MLLTDLDGTIVKGSLVLNHALFLEQNGIIPHSEVGNLWFKDQKNETYIQQYANHYREQLLGMKEQDLYIGTFLELFFSQRENFYLDVVQSISNYRRSAFLDNQVLIVSGSPSFLVEQFANRLGIVGHGSIYETDSKGRFNGGVKGLFSYNHKRNFLDKNNIDTSLVAFGDTSSDKALFEVSLHNTLVQPTQETVDSCKDVPNLTIVGGVI